MKLILFLILCNGLLAQIAVSKADVAYELDQKPFLKFPNKYMEFRKLHNKFQVEPLTREEHKKRLEILESILKSEPQWLDGYWLHGSESFILGSSYPAEKDYPIARKILSSGLGKVETCLERDPKHMMCLFFKGSLLAKIASIDGIFASLKHGGTIRDAFKLAAESSYNFQFRPNVSMKGAAHYGLGLFYRLVPDNFLIDWIWGIRGNLDRSIELHEAAISYDKSNPCSLLMLSVALLCKFHDEPESSSYQKAMTILDRASKINPIDTPQEVCVQEVPKIRNKPDRTCGYTQAKYQEEEES